MTSFRLPALSCFLLAGCGSTHPAIEFTQVPDAGPGGSARIETIAGRTRGAKTGQRIVLFARSGTWWVQPFSTNPFTPVRADSTWRSRTHVGTEYAALLVDRGYVPPKVTDDLPGIGAGVLAVARVDGKPSPQSAPVVPKLLQFSGYDWEVMQLPTDSGGVMHINSPENAWTDAGRRLHLRIVRQAGQWTCAEVILSRSLGYGLYSFTVRKIEHFEPGTVLGMFTWDLLDAGQSHREIDVELSQWGEPGSKNAQFTIQPDFVAANLFRFVAPGATLTHSFRWEPGRVSFRTVRHLTAHDQQTVAEHVFTSGVPTPGAERVHINLYIYGKSRTPPQNGVEVVIDKFEYLP